MIPKRVKLGGFLCYREEQEIRFDGSSLWMLAGLNGSGKSSIFDAVTYALFNSHRGGSSNAADLINKDSNVLTVEFDFELQKSLYQIRRTYKRDSKGGGKGTQQISVWQGDSGKWAAIPDTNGATGFKKWIDDHLGLNYEIFTSSVLLRQGHAEKLLESTPSERVRVLSGIVDMDRFVKLHERADDLRKQARAAQEATAARLEGVPEVTDLEWAAAGNRIDEAGELFDQAEAAIERLRVVEAASLQWTDLLRRQAELQDRQGRFQTTLAEAEKIEAQYLRLRELREVIPPVLTIQAKQQALQGSQAKTARLEQEKTAAGDKQTRLAREAELARKKRDSLQQSIAKNEEAITRITGELPELAGHLATVRLHEELGAKLDQLQQEIDRLPVVTREQTEQWEARVEALQQLAMAIPVAERFERQRSLLAEAAGRRASLSAEIKAITERGLQTRRTHDEIRQKLTEATEARAKADEKATAASTRQEDARRLLDELTNVGSAKLCRACGQALTESHLQTERTRRQQELKAAVLVAKTAAQARTEASGAEQELQKTFAGLQDELGKLRDTASVRNTEQKALIQSLEQLAGECRSAHASLPETLRKQIAPVPADDWTTTVWPTPDDLRLLKREAGELDEVKRQLTRGRATLGRLDVLRAEAEGVRRQVAETRRTLPPGDPATLRQRETTLKAEEQAARSVVAGARADLKKSELEIEKLGKDTAEIIAKIAEQNAGINGERIARDGYQDAIDRALTQIPEAWRVRAKQAGFAEQNRWKSDLETLVNDRVEARYDELARVRAERDSLRREIEAVVAGIAAIEEGARRSPDDVRQELAAARATRQQREAELQKAREERAVLDRHREQRKLLGDTLKGKDQELKASKLLAELLGKDRLQLHLMRTAEKQIVQHANSILDRLSGGQLFLKLAAGKDGAGAETALDMEACNRQTGGKPINVTFLSGSQRFRIAVSLALAIGQYASKQHRPIESVIIDEGFGCLDRNGRQVMIQELQNLRGHLECILLVSHQEEFSEAFPDGYQFELADGAARVTRFQA